MRYHFFALLTTLIWGTTFTSSKLLLNLGFTPVEIVSIRFLLAYICMVFISHKKLSCDNRKDEALMLVLGIAGGSLYFVAENAALYSSYTSTVSLMVCSTPLVTLLMDAAINRRRIAKGLLSGSLIACVGMATVILSSRVSVDFHWKGIALALCASLCWSVYTLVARQVSNRYATAFITRKVFFYGFVTLLPCYILYPLNLSVETLLSASAIGNLIFLGIVASLGGYLMWNYAIKHLGAIIASNYIYLQPAVTAIAAVIVLNEQIGVTAVVGMMITLGGLFIAQRASKTAEMVEPA